MKYIMLLHKANREYIIENFPNLTIETNDNTKDNIIHIDETVKFQKPSKLVLRSIRGNFYFDAKSTFEKVEVRTGPGCFEQNLIIGNNNHFEENFEIVLNTDFSSCSIGNNCYFKRNVEIWVGDGHAILDKTSMHAINCQEWSVNISDNVLIDHDVVLLKRTKIGFGSIINPNSVITKDFSENKNVLLSGSPARIMQNNVAWKEREVYV